VNKQRKDLLTLKQCEQLSKLHKSKQTSHTKKLCLLPFEHQYPIQRFNTRNF
jgi:hypothetical protein